MRILLDTNACAALLRGKPQVTSLVHHARQVLLSTVVLGELLFGFRNGSQHEKNRQELDEFLANLYVDVIPVTFTTADRFGRIATALRQAGTPIPTNDIWIAAHAIETGADLLSYDRHFETVAGLVWIQLFDS